MSRQSMLVATTVSLLALSPLGASAQDIPEMTLRLADTYPTTHAISIDGSQYWASRVEELSGGKIKVEYFPAGQLGKAADMLSLLQNGVANVAYVAPGYITEKMPLSDVAMLPGLFTDTCKGSQAYVELAKDGPINDVDYVPNGIKILFASAMPAYQMYSARHPFNGLEDLRGMKIRTSGGASNLVVEALGGIPVSLPGGDVYEGLERGTLDFNMGPHSSSKGYSLFDVIEHATVGFAFTTFIVPYSVSTEEWNGYPEAVRDILTQAGDETTAHLCAALEAANTEAIDEMGELGIDLYTASDADLEEFSKISGGIAAAWAEGIDARGLPGTEALDAFKAHLAE